MRRRRRRQQQRQRRFERACRMARPANVKSFVILLTYSTQSSTSASSSSFSSSSRGIQDKTSSSSSSSSSQLLLSQYPHRRCFGNFLSSLKDGNSDNEEVEEEEGTTIQPSFTSSHDILQYLNDHVSCEPWSIIQSSCSTNGRSSTDKKAAGSAAGAANRNKRKGQTQQQQQQQQKEKQDDNDTHHRPSPTSSQRPYHVMMLLSQDHRRSSDQGIIVAASLLNAGMHVTIPYFYHNVTTTQNGSGVDDEGENESGTSNWEHLEIVNGIFAHLPNVDKNDHDLDERFEVVQVIDDVHDDSSSSSGSLLFDCQTRSVAPADQPFEHCNVLRAPAAIHAMKRLIQKEITSKPVDVLLMDGAFLGGLVFSEVVKIPTVALTSYQTLELAVEHDPAWTPAAMSSSSSLSSGLDSADNDINNMDTNEWSLLYRMYRILKQRMYSLSLTNAFMKVNRMRKSLHLAPFKSPMDVFRPVVAFLVEFAPHDMIPHHVLATATKTNDGQLHHDRGSSSPPPTEEDIDFLGIGLGDGGGDIGKTGLDRVHLTQPLVPPCSPCIQKSAWKVPSQNTKGPRVQPNNEKSSPRIIIVSPMSFSFLSESQQHMHSKNQQYSGLSTSSSPSPEWTRSLIKELVLVRRSLGMYDECAWDALSCAQNEMSDFHVVWLNPRRHLVAHEEAALPSSDDAFNHTSNGYFPPVYPDFIHPVPSASLLDSVIQHPTTVAVVTHCDTDAQVVASLGVDVLCISHSDRVPPPTSSDDNDDYVNPTNQGANDRRLMMGGVEHARDPTQVSTQLLGMLRHRSRMKGRESSSPPMSSSPSSSATTSEKHSSGSVSRFFSGRGVVMHGMDKMLSIVEAVAETHRNNAPWKDVDEMTRLTTQAVTNALLASSGSEEDSNRVSIGDQHLDDTIQQPYDAFTVLVAWMVFLAALTYVLIRDFNRWRTAPPRTTPGPHHQYHHNHYGSHHHHRSGGGGGGSSESSLSDGILTRLPDLDDAWDMLIGWYHDQPFILGNKIATNSFATSGPSNSNSGVGVMKEQGQQQQQPKRGRSNTGTSTTTLEGVVVQGTAVQQQQQQQQPHQQGHHNQGQARRRRKAKANK